MFPSLTTRLSKLVGRLTPHVQVQIRYTRLDGTKCLRVMTKTQLVTKSRAHAEQSISVRVTAARLIVFVVVANAAANDIAGSRLLVTSLL